MGIRREAFASFAVILLSLVLLLAYVPSPASAATLKCRDRPAGRERTSLNVGWRFQRSETSPDGLSYDQLKAYILPSANDFIKDPAQHHQRPSSPPPPVDRAQAGYDDSQWEQLDLPHDWAVKGPFYTGADPVIDGSMGRLPIQGVGWYRRTFALGPADEGKAVYLDVDGAMSYAMVWVNGNLVGGWPYGYASFRLDLTPYVNKGGEENQLAIRLDNAVDSSRFYPGAGIYRNVWLTKVSPVHIGRSGTWVRSRDISTTSATLDITVQLENTAKSGGKAVDVSVVTDVHVMDAASGKAGDKVATFPNATASLDAGGKQSVNGSVSLQNPRLWGPRPEQEPNMYVAVSHVYVGGKEVDTYETPFGVRTVEYSGETGLSVNGQHVFLKGICQHHDLGALGAAFSVPAAERQLQVMQDMGVNSLRTSHNPPAPELLQLADRMGILVLDEIFDTWRTAKVTNDFHRIFDDWHEADTRAFVRRDRNHPSVFLWSFGNEVAEQSQGDAGAATARALHAIVRDEDPTRQTCVGMDQARPGSAFTQAVDTIGLNYQGEGRGDGPPAFPSFHAASPGKMIFSTESSSAVSSRGTFLFPVTPANSSIVRDGNGADDATMTVSSYDLYAVSWGASPEKVFFAQDTYPWVAGEYVWTGWDYVGEPTPYADRARSSYFGIVDLAGFPKERYYLYQSRWRPDVRNAHILPHWDWPGRVGQVTPVHVFSSADEAELFVNGESQGRVRRAARTYRFRWDQVVYQPGEVRVETYKDGAAWASATVRTTGKAKGLRLSTYKGRAGIRAGGDDLAFVSLDIVDERGDVVPLAGDDITFSVDGPGEIVATDNGDPRDYVAFPSKERKAFNGHALAIVRARAGATEPITVKASADGLEAGEVTLKIE
ncbi:uncharacterized protein E0L32_003017 [Thyridium curvatum]|uniref:Beta-galactosidase n=1 Tax=Thyridium curvatum TaxID=1093900 RepID=A0A507BF12_9PEZI|nr:uncharacterized protein E0L32_003017 [Thyridium curvatum]TPX17916.1 hypothetical protein E0L32_003017 [Thyridium curvatum]